MTVDRHHPLTVETLEEHRVTEVRWCYRLGLLRPRAVQRAALGVGHALRIVAKDPRRPEHTKTTGASTEKPRAVSHLVPSDVALFVAFPTPR